MSADARTAIATALATLLPEGVWSVEEVHERFTRVVGADGRGVCLISDRKAITVSGTFPKRGHYTFHNDRTRINVSPDREAMSAARDIMRRFWPEYAQEYAAAAARAAAHDERTGNALRVARSFKDAGIAVHGLDKAEPDTTSFDFTLGAPTYARGRIDNDSVRFEAFSVDVDTARAIFAALQNSKARK